MTPNRWVHKHVTVNKIWSDDSRGWLIGKYCGICGKDLDKNTNLSRSKKSK